MIIMIMVIMTIHDVAWVFCKNGSLDLMGMQALFFSDPGSGRHTICQAGLFKNRFFYKLVLSALGLMPQCHSSHSETQKQRERKFTKTCNKKRETTDKERHK